MKYAIAIVSDQVHSNFIAWSRTVDHAATLREAQTKANRVWGEMQEEFEARPDYGNGAIMGESVIIHDGENTY